LLPGVTDACYTLTVTHGADVVWRADGVCASSFGDGRGSIAYVGPCDASGDGWNDVSLVLESMRAGAETLAPSAYVNPCGDPLLPSYDGFDACVRPVRCLPNADASVEFDLTIMRDARQGFFDVAVELEDIFCAAKVDCTTDDGPIRLLFDDDGERDTTVVMALACTSGPGTPTILYMDDVTITCDGGRTFPVPALDPSRGPGLLRHSDDLLFDIGIYRGAETAAAGLSRYWNIALGIRDDLGPALGRPGDLEGCVLRGAMTASQSILTNGATRPGATYPWLEIAVALNDDGGLTCGHHPIGPATATNGVIPRYTGPAGREFDAWFDGQAAGRARQPPTPCTSDAQCAVGELCQGGLCARVPAGSCQYALAFGTPPACELVAGVCVGATKGAAHCRANGTWSPCSPADYMAHAASYDPGPEVGCDGVDTNCDGRVDEACAEGFMLALTSGGVASPDQRAAVGQSVAGRAVGPSGEVEWGLCAIPTSP